MPPTAGIARFEKPIATWSSVVGQSGSLIGTVPMSATADAMFVAIERTKAARTHAQSAFFSVSTTNFTVCGISGVRSA